MILDIIVAVLLILAIYKGYQQGLIAGLFSFIAIIIGLAAAIKLSAVVAEHLGKATKISQQWLPVISFAIVFLIIILLVRLGAKAIQKTVELAMLGWINRLGGIIFYSAIYIAVISILLFYAEQLRLIDASVTDKSVTYSFIQPLGPKIINAIGSVIPVFKNMFAELEEFFGNISHKIPQP